jgi:RNA polymerase sigma factor (sigma-70 family)
VAFSNAELIARVLVDDDRRAFGELVSRHQSQVRSLLRRLACGDQALADDLAQETFLKAYKGLHGYRGGGKFSSWLYRIAYNTFLTQKSRRRNDSELADAVESEGSGHSSRRMALRQDLLSAMKCLTPDERAAISLACGEEATHEEIAETLGWPLGTVKSHILRGKEKLRRRLSVWQHVGVSS